jgi:hypothetical protein
MSDWLELELAHRLAPVEAPVELWTRVQAANRERRRHSALAAWPIAAIVTLILAAGTLWLVAKGEELPAPQVAAARPRTRVVRQVSAEHPESCFLCHTSL